MVGNAAGFSDRKGYFVGASSSTEMPIALATSKVGAEEVTELPLPGHGICLNLDVYQKLNGNRALLQHLLVMKIEAEKDAPSAFAGGHCLQFRQYSASVEAPF